MGDVGKQYCIMRLGSCKDLGGLKTVWGSISPAFQNDPDVKGMKDQMKAQFMRERENG